MVGLLIWHGLNFEVDFYCYLHFNLAVRSFRHLSKKINEGTCKIKKRNRTENKFDIVVIFRRLRTHVQAFFLTKNVKVLEPK